MLVLGLVVLALLQLWYLNKALKLANPTLVCPCKHHISPAFLELKRDLLSGILLLQSLLDCEWPCLF